MMHKAMRRRPETAELGMQGLQVHDMMICSYIMILWDHCFYQNANQKTKGFLPYPLMNFQGIQSEFNWHLAVMLELQQMFSRFYQAEN